MRYVRADGTSAEVSVEIEDIIEAEKEPSFNFLEAVAGLGEAKFTTWVALASVVTVDGEKPGYKGLVARGYTLVDLSQMLAGIVKELGFSSDSTE